MPSRARLHLVEDPEDTLELANRVSALADLSQGRAVCHSTPGIRRHDELAADLLVALGKRFDALRAERARKQAWHLVEVWYEAERIRHLFVLRAHLLAGPLREELIDFGRRRELEIWLVGALPHGSVPPGRRRWQRWSADRFLARWEMPLEDDGREGGHDAGFPEVPSDDFFTFRATCRRLLEPEAFDRVDAQFCASMDDTAAWLRPHTKVRFGPVDKPLELGAVAAQVHGLLSSATCPSEALVRLRGVQAAYFRAGWLVQFAPHLVDPDSGLVPLCPTLLPRTTARLRRMCTPRSTAAMTIHLAAGLRSEGLARLNVEDIDQDGGAVALGNHRLSVPDHARSLVRAQVVDRLRQGARGGQPLFVHPDTGKRHNGSALRNILRSVSTKTAISVGVRDSLGLGGSAEGWLRDRGVTLTRLDPAVFMG